MNTICFQHQDEDDTNGKTTPFSFDFAASNQFLSFSKNNEERLLTVNTNKQVLAWRQKLILVDFHGSPFSQGNDFHDDEATARPQSARRNHIHDKGFHGRLFAVTQFTRESMMDHIELLKGQHLQLGTKKTQHCDITILPCPIPWVYDRMNMSV